MTNALEAPPVTLRFVHLGGLETLHTVGERRYVKGTFRLAWHTLCGFDTTEYKTVAKRESFIPCQRCDWVLNGKKA